jgi:hypothetical protein
MIEPNCDLMDEEYELTVKVNPQSAIGDRLAHLTSCRKKGM